MPPNSEEVNRKSRVMLKALKCHMGQYSTAMQYTFPKTSVPDTIANSQISVCPEIITFSTRITMVLHSLYSYKDWKYSKMRQLELWPWKMA